MSESTALMRRPCTALVRSPVRCRVKRKVYRCQGCGLWETECVCGTGAISIAHELEKRREHSFRQRMLDAMVDALRSLKGRRLVVIDAPED